MCREYVSDMSVLCGAERLRFTDGKAKGVDVIRVYNGKLGFYVNLDRCMDIYRLDYKGINVSYIGKNGLVSPRLTGTEGYNFMNGFTGGFLYTCGLDNIGVPEIIDGKPCTQHGSVSYLPAEQVNVTSGFDGEDYYVSVTGVMKYTALFGSKLVLKRTIRVKYSGDELDIKDEITNENYEDDKYMILYHTNFGYPVLNENTSLFVNSSLTEGITPNADTASCLTFSKPVVGCKEQCFMHTLKADGNVRASVKSDKLSVDLLFDVQAQPYLLEWKYTACGDYVLGVEPTTTKMPQKNFTTIKPFETKTHGIKYVFTERS